jgi:putative ABC transport system permease protein
LYLLPAFPVPKIKNSPVIGVVKDYHFDTLYKNIEPAAFYISSVFLGEIEVGVKYRAGDLSGTIGNIKNIYNGLIDSQPFEYYFLDQEFDRLYQDENRLFQLLRYFQAISAIISGMGLYGLATYAIHKRKKEIGIRKFLGASTARIVKIFYKEIFILVLIADFIALPLGFYLTKKWLDNFHYRCQLGFEPFVFAIISTLMISIIASSIQIFKAINANPIESIRYEW